MLTEQDLTDLEMADAAGDFGRDSKVGEAVEELRALRALRDGLVAYRGRIENADYRQGWQVAARIDALLALAPKATS